MKTGTFKQALSLFLCVLMLIGMLPLNVMAADGSGDAEPPVETVALEEEGGSGEMIPEEPVSTGPEAQEPETPVEETEEPEASVEEIEEPETPVEETEEPEASVEEAEEPEATVEETEEPEAPVEETEEPETSVEETEEPEASVEETEEPEAPVEGTEKDSLLMMLEETEEAEYAGEVRVSIVNNTYSMGSVPGTGAAWDGKLMDVWVEIDTASTMMSAILSAMDEEGIDYVYDDSDTGYISAIDGLAEMDGGQGSGWMGTLNDWFTNYGFKAYSVANGKLENGDEIKLEYTCNLGADLGAGFGSGSTDLANVTLSAGTLNAQFDPEVYEYTLTVPYGTTGIVVTPTAANRNFQVRTFDGAVTNYATGAYYKRSAAVAVSDGSSFKVVCADPAWEPQGVTAAATVYTFTVAVAQQQTEPEEPEIEQPEIVPVEIAVKVNFSQGGAFLKDKNGADMVMRDVTLFNKESYTLADILAEANRLYYAGGAEGFAFADSDYGPMITRFWGDESGNYGYQINGGSVYVGGADTAVQSGNVIDFYLLTSAYPDDEAYTAFASYTAAATDAEPLTVTLLQAGYDDNWNVVMSPCAGAAVTVDGVATTAVTDANGQAAVELTAGTHVLSAVKTKTVGGATVTAITAPVCVVSVEHVEPIVVSRTFTVKAAPKASVNVTFYTDEDCTEAVTTVVDDGVVGNYHQYTVTAPDGWVYYRGKDGSVDLGGDAFAVDENTASISLLRTDFYIANAAFAEPGDYTLTGLTNRVTLKQPVLGQQIVANNYLRYPSLLQNGVKYGGSTVAILDKFLEDFYIKSQLADFSNGATAYSTVSKSLSVAAYNRFTLTAPADAEVKFFKQTANYVVEEYNAELTVTENTDEGTKTYAFKSTSVTFNGTYSYRVSKAGQVTQSGYMNNGSAVNVTFPNAMAAGTALGYDDAGVLLNVDAAGGTNHMDLGVGESFKLRAFRAPWQIVDTTTGNHMIEPDFHYAILAGDGVVSIEKADGCSGNADGNWLNVTGAGAGTAIVAVWYDAIDVAVYDSKTKDFVNVRYGAADPARYGYAVISVGGSNSIAWNPVSADGDWDAEFDTVHYVGENGIFTFASGAVSSVTVTNVYGSSVGSTVQVLPDENGRYNVPVKTGANVICADGDYMVVRAKQIGVVITDNTTGKTNADEDFAVRVGDSVTVSFPGITMPIPKMSGIYNPGYLSTCKTTYVLNDTYPLASAGAQYTYPADSSITFTAYVPGENVLKRGTTNLTSMGDSFGNHRNITDAGRQANTNAAEIPGIFGTLPDVRFTVVENEEAQIDVDSLTSLKSVSIYNGPSTYMTGVNINAKTSPKEYWWSKTTAQMETYDFHALVTADSYYNSMVLRMWYDGEEAKEYPLQSGIQLNIPAADFPAFGDKVLNVEIVVTPAVEGAEAKTYSFVVLAGTAALQYKHPVLKSLSITAGEAALALSPALSYTNTFYTLDADGAAALTLSGTQLQKYTNATNNKQDNSDTVTVQTFRKGEALGDIHTVLPLTEDKFPVGSWTLEDLDVTAADELRITVTSYVDGSGRTYSITLLNTAGSEEPDSVTILSQSADVTVKAGDKASFTVEATGKDLVYQWEYRSSASGAWKNSPAAGADTAALTVSATLSKNGYQYRCKLSSGSLDAYSDPVTLNVWGISAQPKDKTVKAGATASFTVKAGGENLSYQWQYRKSADDSWKKSPATGADTAKLSMSATLAKNGYQYRCKITSDGKSVFSDVVTLTVWGISAQPKDKTVKAGATASFTVKAGGENLSYQWQYRKSASGSWKKSPATGADTAKLSMSATLAKNGYQYRCKVTSDGKSVFSDVVTLTVWGISAQPKNKTVKAGATASFTVKASGENLSYQWQYRKSADGSWTNTTATGCKTTTLALPATSARNGFQYRCRVTSGSQSIYSNAATLTVTVK